MRKVIFLALLFLIVTSSASAEDGYRLRVPDVEEYLRAVPAVVDQAYQEHDHNHYNRIRVNIAQEFNLRYSSVSLADLPFALLLDFQTSLAIGADLLLFLFGGIDDEEWFAAMLEAGLRDSQIVVSSGEFTIGNFDIVATPLNIGNDGSIQHLLRIRDNWSGREFFALAGEMVWTLPLPVTGLSGNATTRGLPQTSQLILINITDLTGDGNEEIIVEGNQYGSWAICGDLYVIGWQDGVPVNLTGDLFHYCLPMAQFYTASAEFDINQPDFIQMIETRVDGWGCKRTQTDALNLIDLTLDTNTLYESTVWCELQSAGDAFNEGDYGTAAEIYREVLGTFDGQMAQYITARLALAQALAGQLEQAQSILFDTIVPEGQMGELLTSLQDASRQPETMCQRAFEFFAATNRSQENQYANPYDWTPANFYFGREPDDPRYFPLPIPAQAGCNYQQVAGIEPTPRPTAVFSVPNADEFVRYHAHIHLKQSNYQDALSQIDFLLTSADERTTDYRQQLIYWRALTLELMGRTDEALAEYIAIYEAAPESAWGMLAALHLEVVDGG